MERIGKYLSLVLAVILVLFSLLVVTPTTAQSIPKPSVPEFTLKYVDNSYDMPPVYGIDQYTGKNVVTQAGYHVVNKSVEVTIKNQAFNNYKDSNGNNIGLNYNIRWKGHFGDYWTEISSSLGGIYVVASNSLTQESGGKVSLVNPNAPFTVIPFGLRENNGSAYYGVLLGEVFDGGKVDFQVEALAGYYTTFQTTPRPWDPRGGEYYVFTGQASDWSNTKTISIPDGLVSISTSPTPNPTPTPSVPEFSWLMILPLFLSILSLAVLIRKRKLSGINQSNYWLRTIREMFGVFPDVFKI
jgi:hypothetical protein